MQRVWHLGSCSVKDVLSVLPKPQPPYTTLASVFTNLKRKGYVSMERQGTAYIYQPAIKAADYKRNFMTGFVHDYFRNSFREMVTFFAKEDKISPEDLKDIIAEIEKGQE